MMGGFDKLYGGQPQASSQPQAQPVHHNDLIPRFDAAIADYEQAAESMPLGSKEREDLVNMAQHFRHKKSQLGAQHTEIERRKPRQILDQRHGGLLADPRTVEANSGIIPLPNQGQ